MTLPVIWILRHPMASFARGARSIWLKRCLQPLPWRFLSTLCKKGRLLADITVHPWLLSVTERLALPPQKKAVSVSTIQKFKLHEWLVPRIMVPVLLGLLIAGAVIIQW
jgi:hypothetical protein